MAHANPQPPYQWQGQQLILQLCIQPKASRDCVVGIHNDRIKMQITAPPTDGKANQHLLSYLAKCFAVPRTKILLLKGENSKHKTVSIDTPRTLPEWISVH